MYQSQSSYSLKENQGCLYLVPTPIGNLQDMTFRAIQTLKEVDYIAAEDTRNTVKLLNYFEIDNRLVSYHEHNKEKSGQQIVEDLLQGKRIALVSDAGMPGISDPGEELVQEALAQEITVIALPGANAALTALIASGLSTRHFSFYGFLDRHKKRRVEELENLKYSAATLIFYEAPHRLKDTLKAMYQVLGNRKAAIVREISKKYEEYVRGTIEELMLWAEQNEIRGEFCLLVAGNGDVNEGEVLALLENPVWWNELSLKQHVEHYIQEQGLSDKDAIKLVAKERKLAKREVYQAYHVDE